MSDFPCRFCPAKYNSKSTISRHEHKAHDVQPISRDLTRGRFTEQVGKTYDRNGNFDSSGLMEMFALGKYTRQKSSETRFTQGFVS